MFITNVHLSDLVWFSDIILAYSTITFFWNLLSGLMFFFPQHFSNITVLSEMNDTLKQVSFQTERREVSEMIGKATGLLPTFTESRARGLQTYF